MCETKLIKMDIKACGVGIGQEWVTHAERQEGLRVPLWGPHSRWVEPHSRWVEPHRELQPLEVWCARQRPHPVPQVNREPSALCNTKTTR